MSGSESWTKRCWVAEAPGRYPYVIWDIPDVREALIEDYERDGWRVRGPYDVSAQQTTDEARREGLRRASTERHSEEDEAPHGACIEDMEFRDWGYP